LSVPVTQYLVLSTQLNTNPNPGPLPLDGIDQAAQDTAEFIRVFQEFLYRGRLRVLLLRDQKLRFQFSQ